MKLVQRCSVVVTEDMPVDPEAHDLQVCPQAWQYCNVYKAYVIQPSSMSSCFSVCHPGILYVIQLYSMSSSHSL